jgi:chromosome segregation ATPase
MFNSSLNISVLQVVGQIRSTEDKLSEKKTQLENFQPEFCEIKKKYEEACKKLEDHITQTHELMTERESAYNEYVQQSALKYTSMPTAKASSSNGGGGGLLGGFGKLFG